MYPDVYVRLKTRIVQKERARYRRKTTALRHGYHNLIVDNRKIKHRRALWRKGFVGLVCYTFMLYSMELFELNVLIAYVVFLCANGLAVYLFERH